MAASLSTTTVYGVAAATKKIHMHNSSNHAVVKSSQQLYSCPKFLLRHFLHAKSTLRNSPTPKRLITPSAISSSAVYNLDGKGIPISDLWKDRKAVVAFARHFGCVLCRKRADYLAAEKDKMDAAGVALVLIAPHIDQAKAFYEQTKFKGEVYADPSYSSYEALKFVSGVSTTFTPGAGLKIIQAYVEGYRQDWALSFEKDTRTRGGWQQGGIIVAGPGKNSISYIHKDKEAGDDPNIEDILKACCSQSN
ncbi:UNVERIFIED_CONTAM: Thioredoxin-like protein AAED1, chloroplastic [Sesamum calycinum]|uniref:Thioredoxin-like protein AAED1, chloroplastic n=1 Tax=Sesamum calycinum TaxID=2727403 RepID=A0AAW2J3Z2_9LAMI